MTPPSSKSSSDDIAVHCLHPQPNTTQAGSKPVKISPPGNLILPYRANNPILAVVKNEWKDG